MVGEGTYVLRDDLLLATPPPHPSDATQINNNPLATTIGPPTTGTKLSPVVLSHRNAPPHSPFGRLHSSKTQIASIQEEVQGPKSDSSSMSNGFGSAPYYNTAPTFGEGNPALLPVMVKGKKREDKLKPKNNIVKSNSSFISRVTPHDAMQRRLNERSSEGVLAFANISRAFLWLDLSSQDLKTENLVKALFTKANPLCHDINPLTKSATHLDIVIGFSFGGIIWYEPITQKYARINKNGGINPSPIFTIRWLPNKENLFLAAHADGTLVVYDKDRDDADFVPEEDEDGAGEHQKGEANGSGTAKKHILKSVQSRNQKTNPVAVWRFGKSKINDFAFSPDGQHLATVGDDGTLTIFDYINERVLDTYRSYFGALLTVTWSPDGQYVLTGGQDDLVSIWSFAEQALVARCVGHESWVRDVKFDPWRCDDRNYRFGSVGDDCRLLLWDFSVGMLGRPKAMSLRPRGSMSSGIPSQNRKESSATISRLRSNSNLTQAPDPTAPAERQEVEHAVEGKASTSVLPPVMSKIVDDHPLCWLGFEEQCILTSCDNGHIREWQRPAGGTAPGSNGPSVHL